VNACSFKKNDSNVKVIIVIANTILEKEDKDEVTKI